MEIKDIIALIIGAVIAIMVIIYMVINQKTRIIEWLKYAVTEAEKYLGGGTGQLKLRQVYDWFTEQFPIVAAILPFSVFSAWVDEALETMENWLDNNARVSEYVTGGAEVGYEGIHKEKPESL